MHLSPPPVTSCPFLSSKLTSEKRHPPPLRTGGIHDAKLRGRSNGEVTRTLENQLTRSALDEYAKIDEYYPVRATTGCTSNFCQAGRLIHTDEPRIGVDKPFEVILAEAEDFLRQLRREGVIGSDDEFERRKQEVLREISNGAEVMTVVENVEQDGVAKTVQFSGLTGGTWYQTTEELEFGLRQSWKHARKCIMRSEHKSLRLQDLRHLSSSEEMALALLDGMKKAFNDGDVIPTAFVFAPRQPGKRGHMIWNFQLLSFAGYRQKDGSILGDPINAHLTDAIIELGWSPPKLRTKWDLLPLVVMAEGCEPAIVEIPSDYFPLVKIGHPNHSLQFEKLGLRWVPVPALTRLGFDIGGVQYTAAPFIGWFMDSEIGIRDLADSFRYDVLPQIVHMMDWPKSRDLLDEVPDYERLALLSRAQTELNFAVHWSYLRARVRMSDSMSASAQWCQFDDEHKRQHGFRLPADPYWLAPPQGSVIPLWHRGGAPNYQPKPMIARHLNDPVKCWAKDHALQRTKETMTESAILGGRVPTLLPDTLPSAENRIHIHFCSGGTIALKLAKRLRRDILNIQDCYGRWDVGDVRDANSLNLSEVREKDVILLVVSSSGRGQIPDNGKRLVNQLKTALPSDVSYAIFGNGDSNYRDTFNGAALRMRKFFDELGATSLIKAVFYGDNAVQRPPWEVFDRWSSMVVQALCGDRPLVPNTNYDNIVQVKPNTEHWLKGRVRIQQPRYMLGERGIKRVKLSTDNGVTYSCTGCISLLVPNRNEVIEKMRCLTGHPENTRLELPGGPDFFDFLRHFVELDRPFNTFQWASGLNLTEDFMRTSEKLPIPEFLARIPKESIRLVDLTEMALSMPACRPRRYSIASFQQPNPSSICENGPEILVQTHRSGRFSDWYLNSYLYESELLFQIEESSHLQEFFSNTSSPYIAFVTGSGLASMRSVLQSRIYEQKVAQAVSQPDPFALSPISMFVGYRPEDEQIVHDALDEGVSAGIIDMLYLMPSNKEKRRVQDEVFRDDVSCKIAEKIKQGASVFVCSNKAAAEDVAVNLAALVGRDVREALGDRYVEEVYQPAA